MKIKSFTTKNNQKITAGKFTLLVGPNNVGKSQTLKDIYRKITSGHDASTSLIQKVEINRANSFDEMLSDLDVKIDNLNIGHHIVDGVTSNFDQPAMIRIVLESSRQQFATNPQLDYTYLGLGKFHSLYMDSESRLKIASKVPNYIPGDSSPKNFLQALYGSNGKYDEKLLDAFRSTFDMNIRLDYSSGLELRLAVSKEFENIPEDPRKAYPIMQKYPSLEQQGDGFRSFVAVVLTLLLSENKVVLLDEPEAFLHPEQARRLGKWIADHIESFPCQLFISTHNSNFLAGLLSGKQPADIYRLNRQGDVTEFTKITAESTKKLSTSPLLSSQRVLEAIFSNGVVIGESDSDRIFYSTVAAKVLNDQEILYIHAHNKQTVKDVVTLLKESSIPCAGVVDIDILNSEKDLNELIRSFLMENRIEEILTKRSIVASYIESKSDSEIIDSIKTSVEELLAQLTQNEHSVSGARSALERIKSESSRWKDLKKNGIKSLPPDIKISAADIFAFCKTIGLFIVPVGELESWLNINARKNRWIVPALNEIHNGRCPEHLSEFVSSIHAFLTKHKKQII